MPMPSVGVPAAVQEQGEVPRIGSGSFRPLGARLPAALVMVRTPSQGELITEYQLERDHAIERKTRSQRALCPGDDALADSGAELQSALAHGRARSRLDDRDTEVLEPRDDVRVTRREVGHVRSLPAAPSRALIVSLPLAFAAE